MIRLSTSSCIAFYRPNGIPVPLEKIFELTGTAGFKWLDINFYDLIYPGSPFLSENWKEWIEQIAETAKQCKMSVWQCHGAPDRFLSTRFTKEQHERQMDLVRRSIDCCAALGGKVCVLHPDTAEIPDRSEVSKDGNLLFFDQMVRYASERGVRIAVENMCDSFDGKVRKYCSRADELTDLVDTFGRKDLGICWDFEHGAIMQMEQDKIVEELGNRLIATHVSDTCSMTNPDFMHVLPLFGNIDWRPIMQALKKTGYDGCLSYEAHNYCNRMPDELVPSALKMAVEIGDYLLSL